MESKPTKVTGDDDKKGVNAYFKTDGEVDAGGGVTSEITVQVNIWLYETPPPDPK